MHQGAMGVAIPSSEQLAMAFGNVVEGGIGHGLPSFGLDALEGGAGGPSIDSLLDAALPPAGDVPDSLADFAASAAHGGIDAGSWMPAFDLGLTMQMAGLEPLVMHQDAVIAT